MKKDSANLALLCAAAIALVLSLVSMARGLGPQDVKDQAKTVSTQDAPVSNEAEETTEASTDEARDTYIATWAARIDAFNAGYPLEGYGATFAAAAWDWGVDPRYSPAIARVESGSGLNCTYSCNAWGWGTASWGDWDSAIYAHVAGLAQSYGYTLSWNAAQSYNELNPDEWYAQVESCLYQIWESDSL